MKTDDEQMDDRPLGQDFGWELARLRKESAARPEELRRLEARLLPAAAARTPRREGWGAWMAPAVAGLAAAVAAVAVGVAAWDGGGGAAPAQETALELSSQEWTATQVHPDVGLRFEGSGYLQARGRDHQIDWRQGRLQVSVTPQKDITLRVQTEEASVAVVGTVFDVVRDLHGTTVSVARGRVEVTCAGQGQAAVLLAAEDEPVLCENRTPVALAERARERMEAGAREEALSLAAEGLRTAAPGSYPQAILHTYRAELLLESDPASALRDAEAALATGQPDAERRAHRAAVAAAWKGAGGCVVARPHLEWLVASTPDTPDFHELALLAECLEPAAPEAARQLWARALPLAPGPAEQADIRRRLDTPER